MRSEYPHISLIVPVFNEASRLDALLTALTSLRYPKDRLEVIIIDNGSTDGTFETLQRRQQSDLPDLIVARELALKGPDAARNTGVAISRGDVLAFTDADCSPRPDWLSQGIAVMVAEGAALVAGHIRFTLSAAKTIAEHYDAVSFLRHEHSVPKRGIAFTANLLVDRQVFAAIGPFETQSGWTGDSVYTARAVDSGFKLVYARDAVVEHPARHLRELLAKVRRIGYGRGAMHATRSGGSYGASPVVRGSGRMPHVANLSPKTLRAELSKNGMTLGRIDLARLWCFGVAMLGAGAAAYAKGRLLAGSDAR